MKAGLQAAGEGEAPTELSTCELCIGLNGRYRLCQERMAEAQSGAGRNPCYCVIFLLLTTLKLRSFSFLGGERKKKALSQSPGSVTKKREVMEVRGGGGGAK